MLSLWQSGGELFMKEIWKKLRRTVAGITLATVVFSSCPFPVQASDGTAADSKKKSWQGLPMITVWIWNMPHSFL